jgi:hypothetical protein
VELPVYEAFGKSTDAYVEVGVLLRYVPSGPALSPEAIRAQSRAEREVQDRVLSSLTAEEFRLKARDGSSIDGYVNSAGLAKLARHPDVTGVGVAGLWGRIPAMTGKRR